MQFRSSAVAYQIGQLTQRLSKAVEPLVLSPVPCIVRGDLLCVEQNSAYITADRSPRALIQHPHHRAVSRNGSQSSTVVLHTKDVNGCVDLTCWHVDRRDYTLIIRSLEIVQPRPMCREVDRLKDEDRDCGTLRVEN